MCVCVCSDNISYFCMVYEISIFSHMLLSFVLLIFFLPRGPVKLTHLAIASVSNSTNVVGQAGDPGTKL